MLQNQNAKKHEYKINLQIHKKIYEQNFINNTQTEDIVSLFFFLKKKESMFLFGACLCGVCRKSEARQKKKKQERRAKHVCFLLGHVCVVSVENWEVRKKNKKEINKNWSLQTMENFLCRKAFYFSSYFFHGNWLHKLFP